MIAAAEAKIPASQLSFSLGNEPDRYGESHPLHSEPTYTVPGYRPRSWSAGEYARQWISRRAMLGPIRLEGPDLAGNEWRVGVARLLREDPPNQIDAHLYPTSGCDVGPPATARRLLSEHLSVEAVDGDPAWCWPPRSGRHWLAVISEGNSASCGGKLGLSDTPVASVWAVRFAPAALLAGSSRCASTPRVRAMTRSFSIPTARSPAAPRQRPVLLHRWIPIAGRITSSARLPAVLRHLITHDAATSMIVSSFASHPLELPLGIAGSAAHLTTDTLTTRSAVDARRVAAGRG